jgi:hypothetical protein
MKKPCITNQNCRAPWTFGHRIRRWEVLFEDASIEFRGKEVEVALVLIEGRDVFITIEDSNDSVIEPDLGVLERLRLAKKAVKSMDRLRWKFPRVRCFAAKGECKADVTHLV